MSSQNVKTDFRVLSDHRCIKCKKRLKQNLINKNPDAKLCYKDHLFEKEVKGIMSRMRREKDNQ